MPPVKCILIVCPHCRARVQANIIGDSPRITVDEQDDLDSTGERVTLSICSSCMNPLVGVQSMWAFQRTEEEPDGFPVWNDAERVWPKREVTFSVAIPRDIRDSLEEAAKCLECGAYTACVAMTGRGLEALARHFHNGDKADTLMLGGGLKELYDAKVIDDRLYSWSQELREHRNLAAHASCMSFVQIDAGDLLDFAVAICEYVFVVPAKYEEFMKRKMKRKGSGIMQTTRSSLPS